jgi:formylglycine-generating enzyme required for sulfatase activity
MAKLVPHVRPAARKPTGRSLGVSHVALGLAPMRFVQLTGGGFTMGSAADAGELFDDRGPPHWVDLAGFHIAECPVTQYQWSLLMGGNPSVPEYGVGDDFPVQNMSWLDAAQFANALSAVEGLPACYEFDGERVTWHADRDGYRLPTEAEWEYAARAGTTTAYWFGDDPAALPQHGWYETNSGGKTHKVRSLSPNPWGLYDICGNVWEWVWDWYDTPYSTGPQRNPRGPGAGTERVLRGGAFNFWPDELQAASRSSLAPTSTVWNLGVRIARSALP